ncbi:MAG: alpha amylase C-terminal domain-containing protein [Kiritimatiellae bacterium]|nr:alpha amylase C-terminal domain-containing protein [Kiritimatiellia bacterium]
MARRHLLDDPWLAPFVGAVRARARRARARAAELTGGKERLSDWASAHEYFGLHRTSGGWVFREWAPNATAMWLTGDFSKWRLLPRFVLKRIPGTDVWEREFPLRAIRHGQFYRLEVRWDGGGGERIPAYARRVVQDSGTNLFCAQVWEPEKPYAWRHRSPALRDAPRIYEAHVGMAQEEGKVGTYAEFRDGILPRVKAAGYNVLQLMAVMEHPYYGSFGYHVSSFFAPSSRFGTPEDLKSLVDAAHGMGLKVIMDLVHSHAVKNERDGLSLFDGTPYQYFHDGPRGWHSAWDSRCFDYGKTEVLHFLLSNCRYWLDAFRFDGFRFDGVTSMLYLDHGLGTDFTGYSQYFDGNVDDDAWCYLALANRVIHEVRPGAITVAEDVSGMPGCAAPPSDCGMGFDYRMAMGEPDYWFRLAEKVRDEDWNMHGLFHALTDKRAEEKVVSYVESHDQALVGGKTFFFQLVDKAVYWGMGVGQHGLEIDRGVALHKMARLATFACSGGAYLNFMGNEFGHPEWIDFPRAENGWDFSHARRQWSLRDDPALRFKCLGDFDAAMMRVLSARHALRGTEPVPLAVNDADQTLAFWRGGMVFVFNFSASRSYADYSVLTPPGRYRLVLDTDEARFGGQGRIAAGQTFFSESSVRGSERVDCVKLYLPARTAVVLEMDDVMQSKRPVVRRRRTLRANFRESLV